MLSTDIKWFRPLANGRCGATVITSGVVQNVFPHVTSAQRAAGLDTYKKTFAGLTNTDNLPLLDPEDYHDAPTISPDDYVVKWLSGQRTTEAGLEAEIATADLVGTAYLKNNIAIGALTFVVTVKNAALLPGGAKDIFKDGYKIKVCSHTSATATNGAEEVKTISGTPTYVGLDVTITVTEEFVTAFTASTPPYTQASVRVSSLLEPGDVQPSNTAPFKTSTAGTIDAGSYPLILDNQGTVDEDIALTFTDATHFTATGDSIAGTLGSGDTGTDFAPSNPDFTRPYFTIEAGFWGGTWQAGDTVTFTTHPARIPQGQCRIVPAGSASLANNKCTQVLAGEAAS